MENTKEKSKAFNLQMQTGIVELILNHRREQIAFSEMCKFGRNHFKFNEMKEKRQKTFDCFSFFCKLLLVIFLLFNYSIISIIPIIPIIPIIRF